MTRLRPVVSLITVLFFAAIVQSALAQKCSAPNADHRNQVVKYLIERYHLQSPADVTLIGDQELDSSCITQLTYSISGKNDPLVLYLSADGYHIAPVMWDIRIDPAEEERAKAASIRKDMEENPRHVTGAENAPVTIVEFSDFECPFCRRLADTLEKEILPAEGGKARLIVRNYPLPMHKWALQAAQIGECASRQDPAYFWKLQDYMFAMQSTITTDNLRNQSTIELEKESQFDLAAFDKCLDQQQAVSDVQQDITLGHRAGVQATPTLFINGIKSEGAKDAAQLKQIIDDSAETVTRTTGSGKADGIRNTDK
jgi:protein-disulfide isomerase